MRIWTLHPKYLDRQGLLGLWREALLAQKVLLGKTTGYRNHPQLERFKQASDPTAAIAAYLSEVCHEAERRKYRFDKTKIISATTVSKIVETDGQLLYEWEHLKKKLLKRQGSLKTGFAETRIPCANPIFHIIPGGVRSWEKQPKIAGI